jgi:hypothetical protein
VPESEMTIAAEYVGAEDASVVAECGQGPESKVAADFAGDCFAARCPDDGRRAAGATVSYYVTAKMEVTASFPFTAAVVTAR